MQLFVFWFIALFAVVLPVNSDYLDQCVTPNGEQAVCISIYECTHFLNDIKNRTKEIEKFMQASYCGLGGPPYYDVLICCGSINRYSSNPDNFYRHKAEQMAKPSPAARSLLPARDECGFSGLGNRIVGGNETSLHAYPWMALLEYEMNGENAGFNCGGFLINERYVATAAHCVKGRIERDVGTLFRVRLGEHDTTTNPDCRKNQNCNEPHQDFLVEKVIIPEQFAKIRGLRQYDIALIRLNKPVEYSEFVMPICLPTKGEAATFDDMMYVAGWGRWGWKNDQKNSTVKRHVDLKLFPQSSCNAKYGKIVQSQLCAGGEKDKDSCNGDSGGPLMNLIPGTDQFYAEGIVSNGPLNCGTPGSPGIYTRVATFLDWIQDNLEP